MEQFAASLRFFKTLPFMEREFGRENAPVVWRLNCSLSQRKALAENPSTPSVFRLEK
jgi:hypothetical protein